MGKHFSLLNLLAGKAVMLALAADAQEVNAAPVKKMPAAGRAIA